MRKPHLAALFLLLAATVAHALDSVPQSEYRQRRIALAEKLKGGAALLFAAEEPQLDFMPYRQDEDFYYLSGWNEPGAALLIISAGPGSVDRLGTQIPEHSYREVLFLPARNLVTEKYTGIKMDAATKDVTEKTGFAEVMSSLFTQTDMPSAHAAVEFTGTTLGTSGLSAKEVRPLLIPQRMVKSDAEIDLLRKAAAASAAAQKAGMKAIKPGVRERTIAGLELAKMLEGGCERPSYAPIVGSGINSTTLHYSSNEATMEKGDVVVIDAACEYSMYASDITRTMPIGGKFTPRQRELYEIVLGAHRAAAAAFVAGKMRLGNVNQRGPEITDTLDKIAYDYINTHGKDLHGEPLGKYFLHGLGHHVGINVHDPYDPAKPLDKGNVFTIEPGLYLPEEKIGIRIEDTYYVDADGKLVDLITNLPLETNSVEAGMR
ncbi:MAG: aminopeptidase P N-terminal domain-containing protein [Acidobacteria bacterium]|nr:aminopeptidase P N-terminal domain-containing protein [Acidobacteriota bacterium]